MSVPGRRGVLVHLPIVLGGLLAAASADARRHLDRVPDPAQAGRDLLAAGDAEAALAEFERVLGETGDPAIHIDIAEALSALGRHVESVERYETFLSTAAEDTPEETLGRANEGLAAEMQRIGMIEIVTEPDYVEVRLDGAQVGWTPLPTPIRVNPGRYLVELFHPRFEDELLHIEVEPGEVEQVRVVMREPPPPPPPPSPEIRGAQAHAAWSGGGWNPVPCMLPWGWAERVPAGVLISGGIGYGDITQAYRLTWDSSGTMHHMVGGDASVPLYAGYRFEAAPMFAVGLWGLYQEHTAKSNASTAASADAHSWHIGIAPRVYVPLGLLEPFVGAGIGYAAVDYRSDGRLLDARVAITYEGMSFPLTVGFDVVPWRFVTAGFSFTWAFGVWFETCHWSEQHDYSRGCYDPATGPTAAPGQSETVPDAWWFDFHVTAYIPTTFE